ncbi:hypothetical protein ACHQM5_026804 [Ranunculus cassubicifolius]
MESNSNSMFTSSQIKATFYPKFDNEKSNQEVRSRMIELVSNKSATLEVSIKHSGSLFMYAGGGEAYCKNSFGNIYTAVGVFVLARTFVESWGSVKRGRRKQEKFDKFLVENRMCVSMELVTAVLGDHGQRPKEDYVVVTAVTELGNGKPRFYSTSEIIGFCRKWRLPTNHVWLFTRKKSVSAFFSVFDVLCEEGIATTVCKALDELADVSVPGSIDHVKMQGEILEGLVARIVSRDSKKRMKIVLKEFPLIEVVKEGGGCDFGPSLREVCDANWNNQRQTIRALLENAGTSFCPNPADWFGVDSAQNSYSANSDKSLVSRFLEAQPTDYSTTKLQEMIRLVKEKGYNVDFKCYRRIHRMSPMECGDNLQYKMIIHIHQDHTFQRYQKAMKSNPRLWPMYRGFFIDINIFEKDEESVVEIANNRDVNVSGSDTEGLADGDANLMIKLKFLTYKLRTFLIRNGLDTLFKMGKEAYKSYYIRQMQLWNTSPRKQRELGKMLDEWASYIMEKCKNNKIEASEYLNEAEPFLEQYAKRCPQNQVLIGSAGDFVRAEDILSIIEGGMDEEGDLGKEQATTASVNSSAMNSAPKDEGLIVFFPGIPGCGKSALCKEILKDPSRLGDERPINSLMGDLVKCKYWQQIAEECRKQPYAIILADKNAPNEDVWMQIEDMCRNTRASAIPVIPDSEGTDRNPFSLDALAVFIFRVILRANHPGRLDQRTPNPGYVLLMFYSLYDKMNREQFESELIDSFGTVVKMPLLNANRAPLPSPVKSMLEDGLNLYKLHIKRHGKWDSLKGSYSNKWANWEKNLREVLLANAEYLNSIQVPFDVAVEQVLEQLRALAKGGFTPKTNPRKRKLKTIMYAAVTLPVTEVSMVLRSLVERNPRIEAFLKGKDWQNSLKKAHVTLAHKKAHGPTAVASYGVYLDQNVPVEVTALFFCEKSAALEVRLGSIGGERITAKNNWPHITIWTAPKVTAREANSLPDLLLEGKATRIDIDPPTTIVGTLDFY